MMLTLEKLHDLMKPVNGGSSDFETMREHFKPHWAEVQKFKNVLVGSPNIPKYLLLEKHDRLHLVVMRIDQKVVGYNVHFIIVGHPHYAEVMTAEEDMYYISPPHRGNGSALAMQSFALKSLK